MPEKFHITGDLAIDTETMGLDHDRDRLCVIQISNGNGDCTMVHFDGFDYKAPNLRSLLLDETRQKIFHYARFDLATIKKYLGVNLSNIFCTKIASKLTRTYTENHGLKDLCRELINVSVSKHEQSSYWGAEFLSNAQKEYAAKDVVYLHSIKNILMQRLIDINRHEIAKKLFDFLPVRAELDLIGWKDIDIFSHRS